MERRPDARGQFEVAEDTEAHQWRSVDIGHHSLRWVDREHQLHKPQRDHEEGKRSSSEAPPPISQRLTLDRLALCELESISQSSLSKSLGREAPFNKWINLDHLSSSPFLGAMSLIDRRDNQLWVNTQDGEYKPHTIFSNWLNDILSPTVTIGEARPLSTHGLIWLTSPSRLPSVTSMV